MVNIEHSVKSINEELEKLHKEGVLGPNQLKSIQAQLPQDGQKSGYVDPHFKAAHNRQNKNHPAHPDHPEHNDWASSAGKKLGNAALFGAGSSIGHDIAGSVGL